PIVETNAHVILADDGNFYGCTVYFPYEDGTLYESAYWSDVAESLHDAESILNGEKIDGIDYARLTLTEPGTDDRGSTYPFPPKKPGFFNTIQDICRDEKNIEFGEKIYVLGYPGVGGESLTITEGIVSGFLGDYNQWIKVSANINSGNSGGVAIGAENGCIYGIPTQTVFDEIGSIGQLLSYGFISAFGDGLTGKKIETSTIDSSKINFLTYSDLDFGFKINYPSHWILQEEVEGAVVAILSPPENALDQFHDNFIVLVEDLPYHPITSSEYTDLNVLEYEQFYPSFYLLNSGDTILNGKPAHKVVYTWEGDFYFKTMDILTIHNNKAYTISFTAEEDKFDIFLEIVQDMIDSFEII
ncbi:trypsin-like peptidase domain-containing protein, partial [archaeon AH-315-M20]|nr:trypsin-like peptidase domain-containing protein [archaeon AH-315-M20]